MYCVENGNNYFSRVLSQIILKLCIAPGLCMGWPISKSEMISPSTFVFTSYLHNFPFNIQCVVLKTVTIISQDSKHRLS